MNWHVSTVNLHFLRLQTLHQICSTCGLYHQWRSEHQRLLTTGKMSPRRFAARRRDIDGAVEGNGPACIARARLLQSADIPGRLREYVQLLPNQHDCAVYGFRVAGAVYRTDEGSAAPNGAGHARDRPLC